MFKKHFNFAVASALVKQLYEAKNRKKNNGLVNVIKSGLSDLKDEIKKISEVEKEIKKPDKILKILDFNNKQNQTGQGLKILTPNQLLSRLPISLAQLNAGNNFEKLENETRQLLYSLCRSKNLQSNFIKAWSILFKNGNNLYEHWKQ